MKKVLAIHDLSVFGRCSLAVVSPIISHFGIQVCPLPTMIFSTHTGNLGMPKKVDLPHFITAAHEHYQSLQLHFDCIYSGYLGSKQHMEDVSLMLDSAQNPFVVIDPVMGDHGKIYSLFDHQGIQLMKQLVKKATCITPNPTEMYILLEKPYVESASLEEYQINIMELIQKHDLEMVIVTGAKLLDGRIVNIGYHQAFYIQECHYVDAKYPGTGDIFTSLFIGFILNEHAFEKAIEKATRIVETFIMKTYESQTDTRYGVMFEPYLQLITKENQHEQK